ncbi:VanZ family protein [Anoxybacteroides rupiense]|uniref:VanZ family protein n=1 Tax=Anoxybacteroides rupiense TaxID=311460 RepID=UPI001F092E7B|nr:VanZ family protein [Anoxybacillus rupiensis]
MLIDFDGSILIGAVLLWGFLIVLLKWKFKKTNLYLIFFSLFYIYLCNVLNYTQFPIILDPEMKKEIGQNVWRDANFIPFNLHKEDMKTSLLNTLLTIPFGFGIPFIAKVNCKRIALLGVLLGICLECLQLIIALIVGFTFKYVDMNDVLFNFSGAILGYGLFQAFMILFKAWIHKLNIKLNPFLKYIYEINENERFLSR